MICEQTQLKKTTELEIIFKMHRRHEIHTDNVCLMKDFILYLVTEKFYLHVHTLIREKTVIYGLQNGFS